MQGRGIHIASEVFGKPIIGFYTTRLVKAESLAAAKVKAKVHLLKEWDAEPYVSSNSGSSPTVTIQSVQQAGFSDWLKFKNKGYSFYVDDNASTIA